uniref:Uncharacterized protein n=1 Tax=candidate division WWE3 bacterium TaxID=2053526 RepID=A0A7C4TNQ1_UNCKA
MSGKILKIAFLAVFVITSLILFTYYYYSNYLTRFQSIPAKTNDETGLETLPLNRILTTKPGRQIQALFIKVDGGILFYKDKVNIPA